MNPVWISSLKIFFSRRGRGIGFMAGKLVGFDMAGNVKGAGDIGGWPVKWKSGCARGKWRVATLDVFADSPPFGIFFDLFRRWARTAGLIVEVLGDCLVNGCRSDNVGVGLPADVGGLVG